MDAYLYAVLEWAARVNSPTSDRLSMGAADLQAKADAVVGRGSSLAVAMGCPPVSVDQIATDSVAEDVLRRSMDALSQLGEDTDPQGVGVGLAAAGRIIKAHERAATGGINLGLIEIAARAGLAPRAISGGAGDE